MLGYTPPQAAAAGAHSFRGRGRSRPGRGAGPPASSRITTARRSRPGRGAGPPASSRITTARRSRPGRGAGPPASSSTSPDRRNQRPRIVETRTPTVETAFLTIPTVHRTPDRRNPRENREKDFRLDPTCADASLHPSRATSPPIVETCSLQTTTTPTGETRR
jgi:hypothetical protein